MSEPSFKDEKEKLERHLTLLVSQPIREFVEKHSLEHISIRLDYNKIDITSKDDNGYKKYKLVNFMIKLFI